ncbi:hypothetical protein NCC49_002158 [Naganishia albida]|nr:hypothetical protein NCC49_002158 [Naganishia albida]
MESPRRKHQPNQSPSTSIPLHSPPIPRFLGILILLAVTPHLLLPTRAFYFQWSSTSYQCYTQTLSWVGGSPPFTAIIAPILQMPFVYEIPDSAYVDGKGQYDITVQLTSGLSYVILMGDAMGISSGGSSGRITVQGYAQTSCLATAARNQTTLDLSFEVFGTNIQQCEKSLNISTSLTDAARPEYNMTVISLDQSFNPYDISLGNTTFFQWPVNVAAGKGFTLMMNDGKGYGYGGVGGSYYVNRTGGNGECEFVGGTTTTTTSKVPTATSTAPPESTTTADTGGGDGPPKSTVIAGASIGALVGIGLSAAVAFFIFFYRRRRRNRNQRSRLNSGKDGQDGSSGIIMADGRRRPADAMSVNLFDDSEQYQDPNDGHYAPVPYDVGASSYSGSPVTPASAAGVGLAGRSDHRYTAARNDLSPTTTNMGDPFGSRHELGYDAGLNTGDRSWSATDTLQSRASGHPLLPPNEGSRMDTFSSPTSPDVVWDSQDRPGAARTKSEEAQAEANAVAAAAATTASRTNLSSYPSTTELTSPNSAPISATGGGFRITNATDADPLLPPQPSAGTGPASSLGRRQRGEPRFVRHADAGRAREEVIDLPPLYTDLVHEGEQPRQEGI